jgi:hypothetical protein
MFSESSMVVHSSVNGLEASSEPAGSASDPNADLFGDWAWKPDRYPQDPGYVFSLEAVSSLNAAHELLAHNELSIPASHRFSMCRPRPWSFPAYTGPVERPRRIGPRT